MENIIEGMTDKQFETVRKDLLLLVIEIIKNSKSLEEAQERVEALLNNK